MATLRVICVALLATCLLAGSAYAKSDTKPLDLSLPPSSEMPAAGAGGAVFNNPAPASSTTATAPTASATPAGAAPTGVTTSGVSAAPGVYYGDTSGVPVNQVVTNDPNGATASCDDATYNKPQIHGSVSTGVVAGSHFSGNYQEGTASITKPLGDCEHPTGSLNISVGGGQGHFNYGHGSH